MADDEDGERTRQYGGEPPEKISGDWKPSVDPPERRNSDGCASEDPRVATERLHGRRKRRKSVWEENMENNNRWFCFIFQVMKFQRETEPTSPL